MSGFDGDPRDVLATGWRLCAAVGEPLHGTRRTTWRVGDDLWLAAASGVDGEAVRREAQLLAVAGPAAAEDHIALPHVVPTCDGQSSLSAGGCVWRLCTHIPGSPVDPKREGIWPSIGSFVARLDAALAPLPSTLAVRHDGVVAAGSEHLARMGDGGWTAASSSPGTERAVLDRAASWIEPRLSPLAALPVQLTHGDCHTPNLVVTGDGVRGAIDLELAAVDPPIAELASPAANLVIDSGLDEPRSRLRALWSSWRRAGGAAPYEALETALTLTRLRFYWLTRDRFPNDPAKIDICLELIGVVLDVVEA